LRRDSPQASRSRHCRAGRPILSLLIPGCSVAGDQEPSRFPVRARCRVDVRNASSPHRGRDLPCRALGKTDSGGGWLRVQLEQPGVLLLRRLGPGGPRGVAVATFGHTGLGMLICRNEGAVRPYAYALPSISGSNGGDRQFSLVVRIGRMPTASLYLSQGISRLWRVTRISAG
jgi:hypothetical protein